MRAQGEQGSGQALQLACETALGMAESHLLASPGQQPAFQPARHWGSWAARGSVCCSSPVAVPQQIPCSQQGQGSQAGKFLCIQSFYSIKISGSYSTTSPLYCPGDFRGVGRHPPAADFPHPTCKQSLSNCWEQLGRNPLSRLLHQSPQGLLCAPCPCTAAGANSFEELFIDNETSVFFPVDKTFSCGPLKK